MLSPARRRSAGNVKDHVLAAVDEHRHDIAEHVIEVGDAVHEPGEQFKGNQDWIAQIVESGAGGLGTLAETLRSNDLVGLMGKLQDLARRQPAIFVGAAMAAGFAAVRLGKVAVAGASNADLPCVPPRSTAAPSASAETAPTRRDQHIQEIAMHGRMG